MVFAQLLLFIARPKVLRPSERNTSADGFVPFPNSSEKFSCVHTIQSLQEILNCICRYLSDLPNFVFVALEVLHPLVKNLPGTACLRCVTDQMERSSGMLFS
jgi:hypothetical protein